MGLRYLLLLGAALACCTACGGGGGGPTETGEQPYAAVAGSWFGFGFFDPPEGLTRMTFRMVIEPDGRVLRMERDGTLLPETATVALVSPRIYDVFPSDGSTWRFWTDEARSHACLLHGNERIAVLEKGATSLGAPVDEAWVLGAAFTGEAVSANPDRSFRAVAPAGLTFDVTGGVTGYVATTGISPDPDPAGRWYWREDWGGGQANYIDTDGGSGALVLLLSPDRLFLVALALFDDGPRECCNDRLHLLLTRN